MTDACNLASRRYSPRSARRAVCWWCDALLFARSKCIRARKRVTRLRRRGLRPDREAAENDYRLIRQTLRLEICMVKVRSWQELVESVNKDPWGLPYKLVLDRLRRPFSPIDRDTRGRDSEPIARVSFSAKKDPRSVGVVA